ncbi:Single-stranded DNA-binding protein [Quillaja saponaria]|uniref:Single-stranded DNA-binding protein n=1 Tax=Quillaja saponaria TaxID=32244 RepID=A0AAD7L8U0_QUISA|nr:Single-stranded DNA-binding protein [Quillaja saponaria]
MLRLHMLSSSSPVLIQYPKGLCPNHCTSQKNYFLSRGSNPNSSPFFLILPSTKNKNWVKCRQSEYYDQQKFAPRPSFEGFNSQSPEGGGGSGSGGGGGGGVGALPPRVFVNRSIYKGKAALTVTPRPPEFAPLDSGAFKISREGYLLLQFAPAIGMRQYDWSKKQVFSLSVTEIGNLISLGARDSCEFFHDPYKGKSEEGQVRKVLKVEPLPDGSGHFFNLSVQNKLLNMDESIYIPVTRAEFAVFTSVFNFILPYLLGWHAFANSIKADDTSRVNSASPRHGGDFEWSR